MRANLSYTSKGFYSVSKLTGIKPKKLILIKQIQNQEKTYFNIYIIALSIALNWSTLSFFQ